MRIVVLAVFALTGLALIGALVLRLLDGGTPSAAPSPPAAASTDSTENEEAPAPDELEVDREASAPVDDDVEEGGEAEITDVEDDAPAKGLPVLVHVLDATTRAPLEEVRIVRRGKGTTGERLFQPLDPSAPTLAEGSSPLTISPEHGVSGILACLVAAPGHATRRVDLDFIAGAEREVLMHPAAVLRLFIDAGPDDGDLQLQLLRLDHARAQLEHTAALGKEYADAMGRRSSGRTRERRAAAATLRRLDREEVPEADVVAAASIAPPDWRLDPPRREWIDFDDLAPALWMATVLGESPARPILGWTIAELHPGARIERTISLSQPPAPEAVPVSGSIELAPEWWAGDSRPEPGELRLSNIVPDPGVQQELIQRQIEHYRDEGGGRLAWDAGALLPGTYLALLPKYAVATEFEVPASGISDVRLVVPESCEVSLRILREDSGETASIRRLDYWVGEAYASRATARVDREEERAEFRFRAPRGRLHVRLGMQSDDYFSTERAWDLQPGHNELRFVVQRRACARFWLRDGEALVPMCDDFHVRARRLDGPGGLTGWIMSGGRDLQYVLSPAGRYSVVIAGIPGFQPSPPVEFDAVPGETVEVDIPMIRE